MDAIRRKCHQLLLADRYNPLVVLQPLEEAVNSQCQDNWYDADLNTALLALYQMYPSEQEKVIKVDVLVKILLKALMQLPEADFSLALLMVPEKIQNSDQIQTICNLAEKLQTASFSEFWDLAQKNSELIRKVPHFEQACRKHILRVVGLTFREISAVQLSKYLGLNSSKDLAMALSPEGLAFINDDSGIVVLPNNPDNHPKSVRHLTGAQDIRLEQLVELMTSLDTNAKQKRVGQSISSAGKEAVSRMQQSISAIEKMNVI